MRILLSYTFHRLYTYISKPIFEVGTNKIVIKLFYFKLRKSLIRRSYTKRRLGGVKRFLIFKFLANILTKFFKKPVELNLIRVYKIYHDPQILSEVLGRSYKKFNRIKQKINRGLKLTRDPISLKEKDLQSKNKSHPFSARLERGSLYAKRRAFLRGFTFKLGGRLLRDNIIPRKSVRKLEKGSLSRTKSDFVNTGRYTGKSKKGSFTITISTGYMCL